MPKDKLELDKDKELPKEEKKPKEFKFVVKDEEQKEAQE